MRPTPMALRRPAARIERREERRRDPPGERGGRVRRRPAAAGPERPEAAEVRGGGEGRLFEEGQAVRCQSIPLELLRKRLPVTITGRYWGAPCEITGLVRAIQVRGKEDVEIEVDLQGTTTETILRWATGSSEKVMRIHMCGSRCEAMLDAENLLHGEEIKLRKGEDPAWAMNLVDEERPGGQAAGEAARGGDPAGEKEEKREIERGRSREREKKKKKKKRGRSSDERQSPKGESKKKVSIRAMARKSLKSVFEGTGMDPNPKVRKKITAKASRKAKKKRKSSSGSSSTETSSGSTEEESGELFEETQKVRKIGRFAPGALTTAGCREMASNLLNSTGGIWDQSEGALQPICCQYFRQVLSSRVTGGQSREALTLSWCLDLLMQGRIAEASDGLMQRLKAIEMSAQGASWSISQRIELVPAEKPIISSRAETREAIKNPRRRTAPEPKPAKGRPKETGQAAGEKRHGSRKKESPKKERAKERRAKKRSKERSKRVRAPERSKRHRCRSSSLAH